MFPWPHPHTIPRSSFAAALQQLLLGDAAMQILAPPNEEVQRALELLQNDWNGFQARLIPMLYLCTMLQTIKTCYIPCQIPKFHGSGFDSSPRLVVEVRLR